MILNAYRSDHPGSLLMLPLIVALIWATGPVAGSPPEPYDGMPLYEAMGSFFHAYPWSAWVSGGLLALAGGYLCIGIARDTAFPDEHGNLPLLFYPLLMGLFPSSLWAHPTAFANIFLLIAFWRLVKIQKGGTTAPPLFEAALSIGMAAMFHLPFLLFLPFIWTGGFILRSIGGRDLIGSLIGLSLPFIFLAGHHYWTDQLSAFPFFFDGKGSSSLLYTEQSYILSLSLWGLIGLLLLVGLFAMLREYRNSNMQGKKLRWVFLLLFPFAAGVYLVGGEHFNDPFAWTVMAFPLSFLFTPCFSRKAIHPLGTLVFYLWLLLLVLNNCMSSYF